MTEITNQIEDLINQGRYFEARSRAENALAHSQDLRLKQLYTLALSKSGVPEAALQFMEPVYAQYPDDPESAGIMGSICKELFKKSQSNPFAIRSRDTYLKNFEATKNFYTGINAAAMSAMAGQVSKGRDIALQVIQLLEEMPSDFWGLATLGEAHMLTKNKQKSLEYYLSARKSAGKDWGKITSVHNQLWLLNHFLPVPNELLKLFSPPRVVAFVGHMIDHPQRKDQRFPASIELKIKEAIQHSIRSLNVQIGYCSLANGGDILFAEAMAEEEREVNIYLPFQRTDFIATSVQFAGAQWAERFDALMDKFPVTYVTHDRYEAWNDIFAFQTKVIFGAATLRSESYHDEPTLLTVLSEVDLKQKEGGTRDTLSSWPFPKHHLNINPDIFVTGKVVSPPDPESLHAAPALVNRPVLYVAYAEVASAEREKILVAHREESREGSFLIPEGDTCVLAAFSTESAAMEFVKSVVKSIKGRGVMPAYKISLHAGPVYIDNQKDLRIPQLSGRTIQQVKKISELATTGLIMASNNFASLLALEREMFTIDFGGLVAFPEDEFRETVYKIGFRANF